MSWVLILYIYAGVLAKGDSVSLVTIPMQTEAACVAAGQKSEQLVNGSTKVARFTCVKNN